MPPLPVITDTFRCALEWQGGSGQTAVNVMHVQSHAPGAAAVDVATAIATAVQANQWGTVVNSAYIVDLAVTPLDGVSGTVFFPLGNVAPYKGAATGDWIPQCAVVVKLDTGIRGRDNRGRLFLPFTGENVAGSGFISSSDALTVKNAWSQFALSLDTDPTTPCTLGVAAYDRAHGGAGAHFTKATLITCETALATQRRRQSRLR